MTEVSSIEDNFKFIVRFPCVSYGGVLCALLQTEVVGWRVSVNITFSDHQRLDNGADVNAQGGKYGNALHEASLGGHYQVVRRLLNHDAVINSETTWKPPRL